MTDTTYLLLGILFAAVGGELFVRGAVGVARWARISPGIIGATVAAFATSSPELSVSINAALAGDPRIALGDALGSNVVNVALILGVALAMSGIRSSRGTARRDLPVALAVPVLTVVFVVDGALSRLDGALLLGIFTAWLVATAREARAQRSAVAAVLGERHPAGAAAASVAGLTLLFLAGRWIAHSAKGLAVACGIDEFVVGATIVAVGTSAPELATTVIAKLRGHDEIGLGTLLGSNIFNGLFIIGVASVIHPIAVDWRDVAVALGLGVASLLVALPDRDGWISRRRGVILLALYVAYLVALLQH